MLYKSLRIYKLKIAYSYKKANPIYKPGNIIFKRAIGINKCLHCRYNSLAGMVCHRYEVERLFSLCNKKINFNKNMRTVCFEQDNYKLESIKINE